MEHYEEIGGGTTASNSSFYELFKAQHIAYRMLQEILLLSSIDQQCITSTAAPPVTPSVTSPPGTAGSTQLPPMAITGLPVEDPDIIAPATLLLVGKLRDAVLEFDPLMPRNQVNEILARGIGDDVAEVLLLEARRELVSVEAFKNRVRRLVIRRSAPIPASKKKK